MGRRNSLSTHFIQSVIGANFHDNLDHIGITQFTFEQVYLKIKNTGSNFTITQNLKTKSISSFSFEMSFTWLICCCAIEISENTEQFRCDCKDIAEKKTR